MVENHDYPIILAGSLPYQISTKYAKQRSSVNHHSTWLKIETPRQLIVKVAHTRFEEKLSNGTGAHTRSQTKGRTDRPDIHLGQKA
jgi:hypothetical protein